MAGGQDGGGVDDSLWDSGQAGSGEQEDQFLLKVPDVWGGGGD